MEQVQNYVMQNWMDVLGTILGLLYLWLELKENVWMWMVGSVMPVIYIFVLYEAGLYADCGMEVYYFLAGIYGLLCWMGVFSKKETPRPSISHTPRSLWIRLIFVTIFIWMGMAIFLRECTDSTVPYMDALSTALSIVALWMLSRKYVEQWWLWFAVDIISVVLYLYKGIYGRTILYGIYTVMAVYGYWVWKRRMQKSEA